MASGGRVLIHATVTSIKDDQILYPSCTQCCSKLQHEQFEKEWYCLKCGISYLESKVSWRFRIAFTVADQHSLTDLAIFGSTLEPYFGTTANNFKKYIQKLDDENLLTEEMLFSALEETFVGHQFYFGIKPDANVRELQKFHRSSSPVSISTITKVTQGLFTAESRLPNLIALQIISLVNVSFTQNTVYYNLNQCVKQNTHCSLNTKWTQSESLRNTNSIGDDFCIPLSSLNSTLFSSMVNESLSGSLDFSYEESVNLGLEPTVKENIVPLIRASGDNGSSYQEVVYQSKSASRHDYDNCNSFLCGVGNTNISKSNTKSDMHSYKYLYHSAELSVPLPENSSILCHKIQKNFNSASSSFLCDIKNDVICDRLTDNESFSLEIMRCETKSNHSIKISEDKSLIIDNNYMVDKQESQDFKLKSSNDLEFKSEPDFSSYNDVSFWEWDCSKDLSEKPAKFKVQSHLEKKNPLTLILANDGIETSDQFMKPATFTTDKVMHTEFYDFPESENLDEFLNSYISDSGKVLEQRCDIQRNTKIIETNHAKSGSEPTSLPCDIICFPQTDELDQHFDCFSSHWKDSSGVDIKRVRDNAISVISKVVTRKGNEFSSQQTRSPVKIQSKECGTMSRAPGSNFSTISCKYSEPLVDCFKVEQKDNSSRVLTESSEKIETLESEDLFSSGYLSFSVDEDLNKQSLKPTKDCLDWPSYFSSTEESEKPNHAMSPVLLVDSEYDNYCDQKLLDDSLNGSIDLFNSSITEELENSIDGIPGALSLSKSNDSVHHLIGDESNGKSCMESNCMRRIVFVSSDNWAQNTVKTPSKAILKEDSHEFPVLNDTKFDTPNLKKYKKIYNDDSVMEQLCPQNELESPISMFRPKHVRFSKRLSRVRSVQLVDIRLNLQKNSSPLPIKGPLKTCMRSRIEEPEEDIENFSQDLFSPSPVESSILPRRHLSYSELLQTSSVDSKVDTHIEENCLQNISMVSTPQAVDIYKSTYSITQSSPDLFSPW